MSKEKGLIPTNEELNVYQVMAKTAIKSQFFGKIGGEDGLLSIMLMARELGLPPMQSLMGGMNVIQGKVELSPRLMNSMIRKAGHKIEIVKSDNETCILKGVRCDTKEEYSCSFTIEDARKAGLVRSGGGWEKFASDMLFARCLSRLARRLFADIISTAYIEGEIGDASFQEIEKPKTPLKSTNDSKIETIEAEGIEIDPEPKEMDFEGFVEEMRKFDSSFAGVKGEEFLLFLSTKKGGKEIPIPTIIRQSLKQPERFLKSYWEWYKEAQEEANSF